MLHHAVALGVDALDRCVIAMRFVALAMRMRVVMAVAMVTMIEVVLDGVSLDECLCDHVGVMSHQWTSKRNRVDARALPSNLCG